MSWTALVETYLTQRRQLGYTLASEGRQLLDFATFAEHRKETPQMTVSLALCWANRAPSGSSIAIARRLSILRPFSRFLSTVEPETVILPTKLVGPTHRRLPPYIFSDDEILDLIFHSYTRRWFAPSNHTLADRLAGRHGSASRRRGAAPAHSS